MASIAAKALERKTAISISGSLANPWDAIEDSVTKVAGLREIGVIVLYCLPPARFE
jgi:hypothetical protein